MPVQIGAPTISGGVDLSVSQKLEGWASQLRAEKAKKAEMAAREAAKRQEIQKGEDGRQMPEKKKAILGVGSKTVEQYNKGLRDAYIVAVDRDNTEEVSRIAQEVKGDLGKFDEITGEYRKRMMHSVDPAAAGDLMMSLDKTLSRHRMAVQKQAIQFHQESSLDERSAAIDTYSKEASRLTRNGDFEGAQEALFKTKATYDSLVDSRDMTRAEADQAYLADKKEVFRQGYKAEILSAAEQDIEGASKRLTELEKTIPKDFSPDEWESVTDDIRVDLNRMRTRAKAKAGASQKALKTKFKDMEQAVSYGFKIPDNEKLDLASAAQGTELAEDVNRLFKVSAFSVSPRADRNAMLKAMEQVGTPEGRKDYIALKKINDDINKMAEEDGYSLGVRQGLIDPIPFNPQDPESYALRQQQVDELEQAYGMPISPLQDADAEALIAVLPELTPKEKTDLAMQLGSSERVWQQLDRKNGKLFAMAGAIGNQDIMTAIFTGQEAIANKLYTPPTREDLLDMSSDYLGDVGQVYGADDYKMTMDAAQAYSAATGVDYEDALEVVTGGVIDFNGYKLELPRGVGEDDFEDFAENMHPETVEELGGLLTADPEDIEDAQWQSMGDGEYRVLIGGMPQLNKSGEPFLIKWDEGLIERNAQRNAPEPFTRGAR